MNILAAIGYLDAAGFRALPASRAKKRPTGVWGKFQHQEPTPEEIASLAQGADAVCILMGACSGNAETLDFDNLEYWEKWRSAMRPDLLGRLLIEVTQNGGHHVVYRCAEIEGNQKLAMERKKVPGPGEWPTGYGNKKLKAIQMGDKWVIEPCLIETRGEGGLILCDPSPGYSFEQGDPMDDITVTVEERAFMLNLARSFSVVEIAEKPKAANKGQAPDFSASLHPHDQFNQTAELQELVDLLAEGGWAPDGENGGRLCFSRPGKSEGTSGTLTKDAPHIFYNFSENADWPVGKGIRPFDLLVTYGHEGNRETALADIEARGFVFRMPAELGEVTEESLAGVVMPESPLEKEIRLLNQEYAQAIIGKYEIIIREREKYGVQLLHPTAFAALEAHRLIPVPGKKEGTTDMVPATKIWRASRSRRLVEGLCFEPGGNDDPDYINLWRGFATKPVEGGSFEKYRWHVENVICSGDPDLIKYTWAWIADIFQNPGEKPGVALCMRGERGVGKGVFVSVIKRLIGKRHAVQLNDRSVVTSQFNSILEDKILVFLDEAFWAGDKSADGRMKGYISEKEVSIERKGVDRITVSSYHRYILASNEDWFVNAGRNERRYLVMNVPATKMQDRPFFRDMFKELRDGGYEALMHWLMHLDTSGVDLGQAPKTQGLFEQALESANLAVLWWYDCLRNGAIPIELLRDDEWPSHVSTRKAYKAFEMWAKGRREFIPREGAFVKELFEETGLAPCGVAGSFRESDGGWGWGRKLPDLASCRKFFEDALGGKGAWENTPKQEIQDEFSDL